MRHGNDPQSLAQDNVVDSLHDALRELARSFIGRHRPDELSAFDPIWERARYIVDRSLRGRAGVQVLTRRYRGLWFDNEEERLLSVWVSYLVLLVGHRLREKLGDGPAAARAEFQSLATALGGSSTLARQLADEIGPGLIRILEQGEAERRKAVKLVRATGGTQPSDPMHRDSWLADVLTQEKTERGSTRPQVLGPRPLTELKSLPEIATGRFELYIDESSDDGIRLRAFGHGTDASIPWTKFAGKSGILLDVILTGLNEKEKVYDVTRQQLFQKLGIQGVNADSALAQKRGVWRTLNEALGGRLSRLAQPNKKGGCALGASVSYCWIRRADGVRRFPAD